MAQKSKYTEQLADEICERIANGETLRAICRDDHMPCWGTVYNWRDENESFAARIARARDMGFDAIGEGTLEIIDGSPERDLNGKIDPAWVAHVKARTDLRLKLLAKWSPKYADKVEHDLKSSDGSMTPTQPVYRIVKE